MKRKTVLFIIIMLIILSGCSDKDKIDMSKEDENIETVSSTIPVEIGSIETKTIYNTKVFTGKVSSNNDVFVIPKMIGKVDTLKIKLGDKITTGNLLFIIDQSEIKKQISGAKKGLDSLKDNYKALKNQTYEIKDKISDIEKAHSKGYVSNEFYENAKLLASEEPLNNMIEAIKQANTAYKKSIQVLNDTYVTSPSNGIISVINIKEGNFVSNQQPSIVISDIDKVKIDFVVTEDIINKIHSDKKAIINIPSANIENLESKIYSVSPSPDLRTGQYNVSIIINNKNHKIKQGMTASVSINIDIKENALVINSDAVISQDGLKKVFVIENDTAVEKIVTTGIDDGEYIEILCGLNIDDKIVLKGQNYLENNNKVNVIKGD